MKNNLVLPIVVAVVVGAVAFFGGMKYQESKAPINNASAQGAGGQRGQGRFGGGAGGQGGAGGRPVVGEILSEDSGSITVKLMDGSSKIVNLSDSTTYSKTDTASKSDLKTGQRVAAFGTANSDGSITAQNVQLNPMFRSGRGGAGRPSGQPRPTK